MPAPQKFAYGTQRSKLVITVNLLTANKTQSLPYNYTLVF